MIPEILQALKYPFVGERYPKRFLFGCVVSLVPIFGGVVALGYAFKNMEGIMGGVEELPRWEDFIGLFLWGIKIIGISLVYGLTSLVPFSLGLFCILVIPHVIAVNIGFFFLVVSGILFLSSAFIIPMALMFMIHSGGSFREALRFEDVLIAIRDRVSTYIVRSSFVWLIGLLLAAVTLPVISILFGRLLIMIPVFYFLLITSYVFGMEGKEIFTERGAAGGDPN